MGRRKVNLDKIVIEEDSIPDTDVLEAIFKTIEEQPVINDEPVALPAKGPTSVDPEWTSHVMSFLLPHEVDQQGYPTTDGLRRVSELLIGEIVGMEPTIVVGASKDNDYRSTVVVRVTFDTPNGLRIFGAAVDVYPGNTEEQYCRFGVATADTRAEGKALRRALKLCKTVTAEERTTVPVSESGLDGYITFNQIKALDKFCRDLDINAANLLALGKTTKNFKTLKSIPYDKALGVLEGMNDFLQGKIEVTDKIRGYVPAWFKGDNS